VAPTTVHLGEHVSASAAIATANNSFSARPVVRADFALAILAAILELTQIGAVRPDPGVIIASACLTAKELELEFEIPMGGG
jgi:hypothetical protein